MVHVSFVLNRQYTSIFDLKYRCYRPTDNICEFVSLFLLRGDATVSVRLSVCNVLVPIRCRTDGVIITLDGILPK